MPNLCEKSQIVKFTKLNSEFCGLRDYQDSRCCILNVTLTYIKWFAEINWILDLVKKQRTALNATKLFEIVGFLKRSCSGSEPSIFHCYLIPNFLPFEFQLHCTEASSRSCASVRI